jgi:hypothetical protein
MRERKSKREKKRRAVGSWKNVIQKARKIPLLLGEKKMSLKFTIKIRS